MVFSSISFLYYFIPSVLIIYFLVPNRFRNLVLLLFSLLFYFYGEPIYTLLILASILSSYIHALLIEKYRDTKLKKVFFTSALIADLAPLVFFKYADFIVHDFNRIFGLDIPLLQIVLPLGISFYTFQMMSYTIDVYYQKVKAQRNILKLGTYVALFPQLIAGPIVRYHDIEQALDHRIHSFSNFAQGMNQFIIGLAKKVILANNLGLLCEIFINSSEKSVLFYWLYGMAFMLQIYFDFSGYSDMAIGMGRMLGFRFPINFNYPYIARSITDFWRRWHISLSSWFRDYLYIPLGGNRVSQLKWIRNIMIVWFVTGLWHGAAWNFVLWGVYFGVLLMFEKLFLQKALDKMPVMIGHFYTLATVYFSWIIFNATDFDSVIADLKGLFGFTDLPLTNMVTLYYLKSYFLIIVIAIVAATPLFKNIVMKLKQHPRAERTLNVLEPIYLLVLLMIATAYLIDGSFNPFIYFRF